MTVRHALWMAMALALAAVPASAVVEVQPWSAHWNEGARDCSAHPHPPLEVHRYDARTFVLRENLCATWEAPFMYLLIGERKALLIDTGDVADPQRMPLAETVGELVSRYGSPALPLVVIHTHRHLDHRAGDGQFARRPNTTLVGYDMQSIRRFYGFARWPDGQAHLDLGNRTIDVLPAPGHNETELVFYDRATRLLFPGDFMMPGRLLVDDPAAEIASADRIADFVRSRPVAGVLGGHIEMSATGALFDWESTFHPGERSLAMHKRDLLALPGAFRNFNGFYTARDGFVFIDSVRLLIVFALGVLAVLGALVTGGIILWRRRRKRARLGAGEALATAESA